MDLAKATRGSWLSSITLGYVTLFGLWLTLRLAFFDGLWWLALLNTFALVLFLPLLVLLPLTLWQRRFGLLLPLVLPLVTFGWLFGERFSPRIPPGSTSETVLTVMSFNVLWSNQEYQRIATAIETAGPDLVALQELRPEHLPAIQAALNTPYRHSTVLPTEHYHTIGLLSRFPIESVTPLADPPFERALLVRVRVEERVLAVVVAHLTPTNMLDRGLINVPAVVAERYARRGEQAAALAARVRTLGLPALVLCDCNFTDTSEAYTTMRAGLTDSFAEAGWGLGYTMLAPWLVLPVQRLDYIWHTGELQTRAARVGTDGGSDHLPVVAELVLKESGAVR